MGNRLLKESIKRSPQIDSLSWFEEVIFYRLIVTVDDYGCTDGRPIVLKHDLFPTRESITQKAIKTAVGKLAECGLVIPYEVDGMPYLYLTTWGKHQRTRTSRHKYPMPPPEILASFSPQLAANCGETRPESVSESVSEKESESNPNPNPNKSAEPHAAPAPESDLTSHLFQIPLNDGSLWAVSTEMLQHWRELYPAVDVEQEIRKMIGWCESNPQKRKTARGIQRFITGWLAREQDKGGNRAYTPRPAPQPQGTDWEALAHDMDEREGRT